VHEYTSELTQDLRVNYFTNSVTA